MSKIKDINSELSLLMPEGITVEYLDNENTTDTRKCKFIVSPLESGFGITVGNALRRVLLSYIPGYAICKINIEGVTNEFASIDGVRQDVITIVMNLKKIILKKKVEDEEYEENYEVINIVKKGGIFTGADISKASKIFEVVNEDLMICDLNDDVELKITIDVNKGVGYCPAKTFDNRTDKTGDIHIDCIYSPIINVSYNVEENFHLNEENRNYDSLTMEVISNGAIEAERAIVIAAHILIQHFRIFTNNENYTYSAEDNFIEEENKRRAERMELLKKNISDLPNYFSSRSYNCLINSGINTIEQLIGLTDEQLLSFRNFGKKSLTEIRKFKEEHQLYLCGNAGQNVEETPKGGNSRTKKK